MQNTTSQSYWSLFWHRFQKHRGAKWSLRVFIFLIWVAILNPFIAGDIPIYAKIKGQSSFPIVKKYWIDLGFAQKTGNYQNGSSWHEIQYDAVIFPIIPYSPTYRDNKNIHYKSPFGGQNMSKNQSWHYLGTDKLGRDVAAGMVAGVRVALLIGLISMLIATLIGIFMGALAGYFGDNLLQLPIILIIGNVIAFFVAIHFAFIARSYSLMEGNTSIEWLKSAAIFVGIFLIFNVLSSFLKKVNILKKELTIPIDLIVMRLVEVMNSIPGLLLIIAIAAIFSSHSLWTIILIIGFIGWTGITRFIRAELLKVRNMEYIQAAKAMGFSHWRILAKHAIPNAIGPVLIIIAFGIARAILAEATLSFLGIGVDTNRITWGTLLGLAKGQADKWWLAIFPGLAIFITVMIFNLIGEGMKNAIDAKGI